MAVTANQPVKRAQGDRQSFPVEESTRIYGGTLVFVNAAGYADDDTASGVNGFAGVSVDESDNSSGADGEKTVEVWRRGVFELTGAGTFAQTDVGMPVYADDNYAIVLTAGANSVRIGTVVGFVSTTKLMVAIKPSPVGGAAVTAALTTITHTAPGTPDYAIQDLTNSSAYGFVTKDEGNTALSVLKNLQLRVALLEALQ